MRTMKRGIRWSFTHKVEELAKLYMDWHPVLTEPGEAANRAQRIFEVSGVKFYRDVAGVIRREEKKLRDKLLAERELALVESAPAG